MNKSFSTQSSFKNKSAAYSQYLALESRLVFDGAVVATAVEVQNTAIDDASAEPVSVVATAPNEPTVNFSAEKILQAVDYQPNADSSNTPPDFLVAANLFNPITSDFVAGANTEQATILIVVDPRVENAALLLLNPPANTQVIILDSARDGFQQIAEQLQNRQNVTELHILPWTTGQQQWLGSQSLATGLEPSVNGSLMDWNDGLADDARLVFHGQDSMEAGWLNHVSTLTGTQSSWSQQTDFNQDNTVLPSTKTTTVVFIDSAVQNTADIISSIDPNAEIVYLDANRDGLTQMADYLDGRTGIDSIQIISHGKQAAVYLGNETLTNDNLVSHADQLATIGQALTLNGDILFYGCELAKSAEGSQFIDSFSYLTQADVAASTDITGAASKGGNWILEYTAGTIEASILAASHYQDILAMPVFDVNGGALLFNNPSIQKSNGLLQGSIILFSNVVTIDGQPIDAVVTIVDNAPVPPPPAPPVTFNIAITALDSVIPGTPPLNGAPLGGNMFEFIVQPNVANSASTIRFDFITSGSYNIATETGVDVILKNVVLNSYDIDNGQFQEFSGFSSHVVANDTHLDIIPLPGNFMRFQDKVPNLSDASPIGNPFSDQFRVTAFYDEMHSFEIKAGTNKTAQAFFYLDFSAGPTWNNPANDPPVNTVPGVQTVNVGVPAPIPLIAHDINNNLASTRLTVGGGILNVDLTGGATISSGANNTGTLTLSGTEAQINAALATVKYTANNGISNDTLNILSTDKLGLTDPDTVDITVNTPPVVVNRPPVAVADTATGNVGTPVTVVVHGNDSDPDGNLDITSVQIVDPNNPANRLSSFHRLGEGIWTVNPATGAITFAPDPGFTGNPTAINYTVKDTNGLESNQALVTITVNRPPIAVDDKKTGIPGTPVTVPVVGNDSDPDGNLDPTTVKIVGTTNPGDPLPVTGGVWTVDKITGAITFTPDPGFTGSPTPISYTVKDTSGLESGPALVTITMNTLPIAVADINIVPKDGSPVTGNVITNEINLGDRPTVVSFLSQGVNPIPIGSAFTTAAGGILILNADGSYRYTPPPNVAAGGLVESFNYTITDSNGDISSATLTIFAPATADTSGSLIQLSNPATPFEPEKSNFFVAQPLGLVTALDLSLYIPTPDNVISITGSLRDQVVLELNHFSFDIPRWSFFHTNPNEQLEFEATRPDGSALPEWLKFNPKLLRFSGTPPRGAHNEEVMVTASDVHGNHAHAVFTVHVNKERARPDHKSLTIDPELLGVSRKVLEKNQHKEKPATVGKAGLSERMRAEGKLGKLQESRVLLDSLKGR